jgi:hypothetical protein
VDGGGGHTGGGERPAGDGDRLGHRRGDHGLELAPGDAHHGAGPAGQDGADGGVGVRRQLLLGLHAGPPQVGHRSRGLVVATVTGGGGAAGR